MSAAEKILAELLEETKAMRAELVALRRDQTKAARGSHTRTAAAKLLGMRREYLDVMVTSGQIKTVPGPTGKPRISQEEIDRLNREGLPSPKRRGRPRKQAQQPAENQPIRLSEWKP